jgi:formamidopyrimidine-DNA glycosylase
VVKVLRRKHSELKRQLLDQPGWCRGSTNIPTPMKRCGGLALHGARIGATLPRRQLAAVLMPPPT